MHSLREAMIVVPKADNRGRTGLTTRDAVARMAVAHFGGCTVLQAEGLWDSGQQLFIEPVWLLLTACEPTTESVAILQSMADLVASNMDQEAVYIRHPDGTVEIRDNVARSVAKAA